MTNQEITSLFNNFNNLKVMVIGDVMIDSYLWGTVERISPEAPVPVVDVLRREKRLGGAANVAKNIKALGAECIICTIIGDDTAGEDFFNLLTKNQIKTSGIVKSDFRPTTIKHRVLCGSQQILRVDEESKVVLNTNENNKLLHVIFEHIENTDIIILQDYDKGVLNKKNITKIIELAHQYQIPVVVDPKKKNFTQYKGVDFFKPNFKEIAEGLNISIDKSESSITEAVKILKEKLNLKNVLLTLSEKGMYVDFEDEKHFIPTDIKSVSDVSGAGDTVISVASLLYALKINPIDLGKIANIAGGLVCEQLGVVPIDKNQFLERTLKEL